LNPPVFFPVCLRECLRGVTVTLILSCVTPEYVFQVSDGRLTWLNGPQAGQVIEDDRDKAVLVDGRFAFGYTGLAEVGSLRTDDWLSSIVAHSGSTDMSKISLAIRDKATEAFRSIRLPADLKGHAFQGVGWSFDKAYCGAVPTVITVHNIIGKNWQWLPRARNAFARDVKFFPNLPDGFVLMSVGQEISVVARDTLPLWRPCASRDWCRFERRSVGQS